MNRIKRWIIAKPIAAALIVLMAGAAVAGAGMIWQETRDAGWGLTLEGTWGDEIELSEIRIYENEDEMGNPYDDAQWENSLEDASELTPGHYYLAQVEIENREEIDWEHYDQVNWSMPSGSDSALAEYLEVKDWTMNRGDAGSGVRVTVNGGEDIRDGYTLADMVGLETDWVEVHGDDTSTLRGDGTRYLNAIVRLSEDVNELAETTEDVRLEFDSTFEVQIRAEEE